MLLDRRPHTLSIPEDRGGRGIGIDADQAVSLLRRGRRLRLVGRTVDLGRNLRVYPLELRRRYCLGSRQGCDEAVHGIVLTCPPVDLPSRHIRLVVVLGVTLPAVG